MDYSVYTQQQQQGPQEEEQQKEGSTKKNKNPIVLQEISVTAKSTNKVDFVLYFPVEIYSIIFSNLTFQERILCTSISKGWRFAILTCPKMWYTLTNDGYSYKLYHVMDIFRLFIRNYSIREIDFTLKILTYERMHTAIVDLNQVVNLLEILNCSQIEKARFSYSCYDNGWFRKFQAISSTTLTYLSFIWDVYPECDVFPTFVIKQFPNLSHFSLMLKDMGYCFRTVESLTDQLQRLLFGIHDYPGMVNDCDNALLSSSCGFSPSADPQQHQNLTILHIDLSTADFILPFPESILTALPNLLLIKFTTHGCTGKASVIRTYKSLYKYCTKIQTLNYNYISTPSSLWFSDDEVEHEEINLTKATFSTIMENVQYCTQFIETFFSSEKTYYDHATSLRTLQLSSVYWTPDAAQHLVSAITLYYCSLQRLQLTGGSVPQEYFVILAKTKFLALREIIFEASSPSTATINPYIMKSYTENIMTFFINTVSSLKYATLKNFYIHADVLNFLFGQHENMATAEKTLVFSYCYGVNPLDCYVPNHKFYYHDNQAHSWTLSVKMPY